MLYDKRIKYLDYYENGERVRGGGFVKLEARDRSFRIDLSVTGLYPTDVFERDVVLLGEKRESAIGRIKIVSGRGSFQYLCQDIHDMGTKGIPYEECQGILISLGAGREISCRWQGREQAGEIKSTEAAVKKADSGKLTAAGRKGEKERQSGVGDYRGGESLRSGEENRKIHKNEPGNGEAGRGSGENGPGNREIKRKSDENRTGNGEVNWKGDESGSGNREISRESGENRTRGGESRRESGDSLQGRGEKHQDPRKGQRVALNNSTENQRGSLRRGSESADSSTERPAQEKRPVKLLEDKWQQLYAIYPHIRPFGDKREYISIGPVDFVLFPAEYYRMANNSFLLHGYYNYRHLILTKMERKGETFYYIGVPGNFYEKEKQVAIMFGFESFECAEEPAQAGDFGYYMMRTEL